MLNYPIDLDVSAGAVPAVIHLKQYQTDAQLVFKLFTTVGTLSIGTVTDCSIRGTKSDGNGFSASATYSSTNQTVTFRVTSQMTAVYGKQPFELTLTDSTGKMITATFYLDIKRAALDGETVSASEIRELVNALDHSAEILEAYNLAHYDDVPTSGSNKAVKSGGVYTAIQNINEIENDLEGQVTDLKSALANVITMESGGRSDSDGVTKNINSARIRNVHPILVSGLVYIQIPSGYKAYVYQLDANHTLITKSGWFTQIVPESLNPSCAYINITIRNQNHQSSDISSEISFVETNFKYVTTLRNFRFLLNAYKGKTKKTNITISMNNIGGTNAKRAHSYIYDIKAGDVVRVRGNYLFEMTIFNSSGTQLYQSYNENGGWLWNRDIVAPYDGYIYLGFAHSESGLESGTFSNEFTSEEVVAMTTNGVAQIWTEQIQTDCIYSAEHTLDTGYYIYATADSTSKGYIRKSTYRMITDFIPVYEGMKLCISGLTASNASSLFGYDENFTAVDNLLWVTNNSPYTFDYHYINKEITIGAGISFVRAGGYYSESRPDWAPSVYTNQEGLAYIREYKKIPDGAVEMYTDDVAVGHVTWGQGDDTPSPVNDHDTYSTFRIASNGVVGLPFGHKTKLLFHFDNSNYAASCRIGAYSNHIDMDLPWRKNGQTFDCDTYPATTYTKHPNYYVFSIGYPIFQKNPGTTNDTAKVMTVDDLARSGFKLYALNKDVETVSESNQMLSSAKLSKTVYGTDSYRETPYENAVIFHTSDPHGDERRTKRFFDTADLYKADLAAVTGDIVTYNTYSGFGWFHKIVNNHDTLPAICTGNHDVYIAEQTDAQVYSAMFSPIATKLQNTNSKTYYHVDIENKKIRVICVNLYQYDGQSTLNSRSKPHINSDQISWLISTLNSTPAGYGVIILQHTKLRTLDVSPLSSEQDVFCQPNTDTLTAYGTSTPSMSGQPIYDIIDAFIGRESVNKSYTQNGTPSTLSVSANFSSVPSDVEFIAYLSGHYHNDTIAYVSNTAHRQLELNVIGTHPYYGGEYYSYLMDDTDIGRESIGITQDSFNAYVIDRANKLVKVCRFGADTTIHGRKRQYVEVTYAGWDYITPTLANGSVTNENNTNAVHTSDYIPVQYGKTAHCKVSKSLTEGCHYSFGYVIYDSERSQIEYKDYNASTADAYVPIVQDSAAYIRFTIVEYTRTGSAIARRTTDYASGEVTIEVSK